MMVTVCVKVVFDKYHDKDEQLIMTDVSFILCS